MVAQMQIVFLLSYFPYLVFVFLFLKMAKELFEPKKKWARFYCIFFRISPFQNLPLKTQVKKLKSFLLSLCPYGLKFSQTLD